MTLVALAFAGRLIGLGSVPMTHLGRGETFAPNSGLLPRPSSLDIRGGTTSTTAKASAATASAGQPDDGTVHAAGAAGATPPAPPAPPAPPTAASLLAGKGMWLHIVERAEGGNPAAIVAKAKAVGITHVYVRLGSSFDGFYGQAALDRLLPVAHAAGLKIVGWDFPYLIDPAGDARRALAEIAYTTPTGQRIDGFSADIETASEGVRLTPATADAYGATLRQLVGPAFPLVATVPRPVPGRGFPYVEATRSFDVIAPMVYWMQHDSAATVASAMDALAPLGKPIMPIGQAYDGALDGGPPGPPSKDSILRFIATAAAKGATGVSFWVWNYATPDHWAAIAESHQWNS